LCSVRVRYCVSLLFIDMEYSTGVVRVYGVVNEIVAIE